MTRRSLTPKPTVPALVRMAAIGTLAWAPLACGDDEANDSNTSDQFPTDACSHDPQAAGCQTTGDVVTASDTDDVAPTIPCAHDPSACESTGVDTTGTSTPGTDSGSESGTDASTGTETGGSSSGTSTTGGA